jgi:hypothetical protein
MDVVKISNTRYDESIRYLHVAYESIVAYSVVFIVNDNCLPKVYTNQNASFAGGNPWVFGIAQNDAEPGEIVEVQYSGMSKVRFYSRNIPLNTIIFLQKDTNGVCCLANENGIETFKKETGDSENGYSIMCGFVPPITQPIMGSTFEPRSMIVDAWIHITTIAPTEEIITLKYIINYNVPPIPPNNLVLLSNSNETSRFLFSYKRPILNEGGSIIGLASYVIHVYNVDINDDLKSGTMKGTYTAHHEFTLNGNNYDINFEGNQLFNLGTRGQNNMIDTTRPYENIIDNKLDCIHATSIFKNKINLNNGNNNVSLNDDGTYTIKYVKDPLL